MVSKFQLRDVDDVGVVTSTTSASADNDVTTTTTTTSSRSVLGRRMKRMLPGLQLLERALGTLEATLQLSNLRHEVVVSLFRSYGVFFSS